MCVIWKRFKILKNNLHVTGNKADMTNAHKNFTIFHEINI